MGERAKKKREADAKAARAAKKVAEKAQPAQPTEDPASTDPTGNSSGNNLPTRYSAKKKVPAPCVPSSTAKQAAQSVEGPASADRTSSDKKLPTRFNTKNPKKTGTVAGAASGSFPATRHSTRSLVASSTLGSGNKRTSAKDKDNENKTTRPERSATVAARALLEQLQFNDTEDTDFIEDPQADSGSDDESEADMIIELDDGAISGDDDDGNGSGNGSDIEVISDIEVVEDSNLKTKRGLVAPAKATRRDLPNTNDLEEESSSDEVGESAHRTRPHSGN